MTDADKEWAFLISDSHWSENPDEKDITIKTLTAHCKELRESIEELFAEMVIHRYGDPLTSSEKRVREVLSKRPQDYYEVRDD